MREFELPKLLFNMSRSEMQSNYPQFGSWKPEVRRALIFQLMRIETICETSGLSAAKNVRGTIARLKANDVHFIENLGHKLSALRNEIVAQLEDFVYLEIPQQDVKLFAPEAPLFGQVVHDNFKSSRYDNREAGRCIALDRFTASVMHLMRAMEPALLAMAREVNYVPPVDRTTWGLIIDQIQDRLDPKHKLWINDRKKKLLLSPAAVQFRHFKDAWRDHAMHNKEKYDQDDADATFRGVRSFMMYLAKKGLKE